MKIKEMIPNLLKKLLIVKFQEMYSKQYGENAYWCEGQKWQKFSVFNTTK